MMANRAMQARHWQRISTITGHTLDVESDKFLLRNLVEAPLLKNKEDIEVCNRVFNQSINQVLFQTEKRP